MSTKRVMLNFMPVDLEGQPHPINTTMAKYLAREISQGVSTDEPLLQWKVAKSLMALGYADITEEQEEYFVQLIKEQRFDNALKGQILEAVEAAQPTP